MRILKDMVGCPGNNHSVFARLFCFAIVLSLMVIANPGFFCQDELTKADVISRFGLGNYLFTHLTLSPNSDFAFAVRPVAFFIQGIESLFLHEYPFLVHLIDVLMHGAVACLLFVATVRVFNNRSLAWASAIIFLVNPLVMFSVGWTSALMDRLYVFFGLACLIAANSYITRQRGKIALLWIFTASLLAMLSKETAVVLPVLLMVYPLFSLETMRSKRLWHAFAAWSIPGLMLLLYRIPALINSYTDKVGSPYSTSVSNIPENIFAYFIYPFMPFLSEAPMWKLQSSESIGIAALLHLVLLGILWRAFSFRAVLYYLVGYYIFLIPVLFIPAAWAHYLYGSGIAFSFAVGALLALNRKVKQGWINLTLAGLLGVGIVHTIGIQLYFYKTGSCQNKIMNYLEGAYLSGGMPEDVKILVEAGAPGQALHFFTFNKKYIGRQGLASFQTVPWEKRGEIQADYRFNCDCQVYDSPKNHLVLNWGPQSTVVNMVPNKQLDGTAGIWIEVSDAGEFGELEVMFSDKPARLLSIQPNLITAALSPEMFSQAGEKKVAIRQVATGKLFPVGTFLVKAEKSSKNPQSYSTHFAPL